MKNKMILFAGFLALAVSFSFLHRKYSLQVSDPDRYYHFALSREMVQRGEVFLRSLPQVEDLGWGEFFVDKEFLFHQVTALGYRINGDLGAEWSVIVCAIACILVLLVFAARHLPPVAALTATFFAFSCPLLIARMLLVRPHVLAILGFMLMLMAVLARRPVATAFAVLFFTLSYHAFYVPLICLSFLVPLSFLERGAERAAWRKVALYGVFGCFCGILANPYFPGSIDIAIIHAKIPSLFKGELVDLNWGAEHSPLRSDNFFEAFHMAMAILVAAVFLIGFELKTKKLEVRSQRTQILYLLMVCFFFFVLCFQSRRAGEYLAPAIGFLTVYLLQRLRQYQWLMVALPLAFGLVECRIFWNVMRLDALEKVASRYQSTLAALNELSPESKGKKVYNCEWDFSPFIFYFRPDLRFLDIMDPSLIYFAAKGPFRARDDLRKGFLVDAYGMIRNAAKADYVLCNDSPVNEQLRTDPGFQQIYPKGSQQLTLLPALFKVRSESPSEYVRRFFVSQLGPYKGAALPQIGGREKEKAIELTRSTYLDLAAINGAMPEGFYCGLVRVAPEEVEAHVGAEFAALGGGVALEFYRNRKPVYRAEPAWSYAKSVQVTVPLSPPLARNEQLEFLVCSTPAAHFWGLSLGLYSRKQFADTCAWKEEKVGLVTSPNRQRAWEFMGDKRQSCLGPMAAPAR